MSLLSDREAIIALKNAQLEKGQAVNIPKCMNPAQSFLAIQAAIPKVFGRSASTTFVLLLSGPLTRSEIARAIGTCTASMTEIIDRGVANDWLVTQSVKGDRRKEFVYLTNKVRATIEAAMKGVKP